MYIFIKITFSVYIKVIHTYTIKINLCLKHLCLKLSFFLYNKLLIQLKSIYALNIYALNFLSLFLSFFLSDGTQGNKHTEQFPGY